MGGVPFLPEEFAGPQEHTGAHFPADDIGPLVHEHGQVAPALHPARKGGADDRFRCGAYNQRLFQPSFWIRDERSEEHPSELQSLMRISYAVFCLKKKIDIYSDRRDQTNAVRSIQSTQTD